MSRYSATERIGVNATETAVVKGLGWIFREQATSDMGIDAHIEPVTRGTPTGQLIGVQIKTGGSHFTEKENCLVFYGDLVHLDYWLSHSLPVILVAHLPASGETYWVQISNASIELTQKAWKVEIPKTQLLGNLSESALLALVDGTPRETKNRNLALHTGNMMFVKKGGKLVVYKEEWHNKSLGRGELTLIQVNPDGSEEVIKTNNFWSVGYDVESLIKAVYPWATVSIDSEYYEENFSESFYDVYTDGYLESHKIYPYAVSSGEVSLYRLQLNLSKLGESFLEVMSYLDAQEVSNCNADGRQRVLTEFKR